MVQALMQTPVLLLLIEQFTQYHILAQHSNYMLLLDLVILTKAML
jgi:hypothetical protein